MQLFKGLFVVEATWQANTCRLSLSSGPGIHAPHSGYLTLSTQHHLSAAVREISNPSLRFTLTPRQPNDHSPHPQLFAYRVIVNPTAQLEERRHLLLATSLPHPAPVHQCRSQLRFYLTPQEYNTYRQLRLNTRLNFSVELSEAPILVPANS